MFLWEGKTVARRKTRDEARKVGGDPVTDQGHRGTEEVRQCDADKEQRQR